MHNKICFVALRAYPILANKNMGYGGGPEVLQVLLTTELANRGFQATFIVYGEEQPLIEKMDGINVIKVPNGNKSKISKVLLIWKAMKKANADIYYHHSGAPGIASIFCQSNRKKFVCHIGSDACVIKGVKGYRHYKLDIKLADVILVQSEFQKLMLMKNFNRNGILIRNFFPISKRENPKKPSVPIVLWVGAMAYIKRPWLFLKLAKKIPNGRFWMIGGIGNGKLYGFIKEVSKKIPNLNFLGYVPFYEIDEYFKKASILVNTSEFEGYPNAFIQAWMHYTPVVSLNADPDEVICKCRLGFHTRTFEQMVQDVKNLTENKELRERIGRNCRSYVEKKFDYNKIVHQYIKVFSKI